MTATTTETTNLRWSRRRAWLVATGASSVIALAVATWAVRNPWQLAAAPVVVGVATVVFVLLMAVTLGSACRSGWSRPKSSVVSGTLPCASSS